MTMSDKMREALEFPNFFYVDPIDVQEMEPVGWWDGDSRFTRHETLPKKHSWDVVIPLYIAPPAALHSVEAEKEPEWIRVRDRTPSESEGDEWHKNVWYYTPGMHPEICVSTWAYVPRGATHWKPTGLRRPEPPEQDQ